MTDSPVAMPDDRVLAGQVALVTGATSGIGLATAVGLARLGAQVACVTRASSNTDELDRAMAETGCSYTAIEAELAATKDVKTIIPRVLERFGRIDILVNSAGVADTTAFLEQTLESFEEVLSVNLYAPFLLCQAAGKAMIDGGRGGRMVNLSSSTAFRALYAGPAYASAKGGLNSLTRAAAGAFGEFGITVNAVVPGLTATRMSRERFSDAAGMTAAISHGPLRNLTGVVTEPDDVAAAVVFLCTPAARQITGQMMHVSGGAVL